MDILAEMFDSQLNKIKKNPPRDVSRLQGLSYRGKNILPPTLGAITLLCILLLAMWSLYGARQANRLSEHGELTLAIVSANKPARHGRKTNCSKISYKFRLSSGMTYSGSEHLPINDSDCYLRQGDLIAIVYLPEQPSVNTTQHRLGKTPALVMVWLYSLAALFLITNIPILRQLSVVFRHRKLFRIGIWVNAKVLRIKPSRLGLESRLSRLFPVKILVAYSTKQGKPVEAWVLSYQSWIFAKLTPGTEVNICYHPNHPGKAFLLESYLV